MQKIHNGKDGKHTNVMDISIIWLLTCRLYWLYWRLYCRPYCRLYWRLFCRLYCRLYWKLFWRLYWRLLFIMQYLFFSFFISAASLWPWATRPWCFSHVFIFFSYFFFFHLFFCHFFNQHKIKEETRFGLSLTSPLAYLKVKKKWIQFLNILFLIRLKRRWNVL